MTTEEVAILESLDQAVQSLDKQTVFGPIIDRVHADLRQRSGAMMAWEPIPLTVYS
jgi:hypothetical protein